MKVYEDMADIYDFIYCDAYDADMYRLEARNAKGPVLEIGCGTGRILLGLLGEGIDVTGIDISEKMLAVLRKKAKALGLKPDVMKADMRDFRISKKFRLIIVPYRSFLHLLTEAERKKTLLNFLQHLDTGGRLILHSYEPSQAEMECSGGYRHYESEDVERQGARCHLDWYLDYDRKTGVGHYRVAITKEGKEQKFDMDLAIVPAKEMKALLVSCGYKNITTYCGFDYMPYAKGCPEVLWFAEK
ncbi:class I SAM-dependent methyltransferase [Candidatus Micrarchaeota archaeon]|nr:class I SAM-dependent methyltransferase [Candidatus Micrarchaeota archaeon]